MPVHSSTRLLRATLTPAVPGDPLHPGPVFATAFHTPGDPALAPYSYARSHNPTWTQLEQAISGLELPGSACETRVFASGQAAVYAAFAITLRSGDTVVLPAEAYFAARQLLQEHFAPAGITIRAVPTDQLCNPNVLAGARLLWLETPSNPTLAITDIAAAVTAAKAAGVLVAVDNTTATPLAQRPLAHGADLSVSSDSKTMSGHSDLLLGHVSTASPELAAALDRHRTLTGGIAGPMEAWLALRSLGTLPLRLERTSANALAVAEFLLSRPEVSDFLYPGLPTHPGYAIAQRQMDHFGAVLSFTLPSKAAADRFFARTQLVTEATSFGGIVTTAERRARWGHDAVAPGFIRMSAGVEAIDDLRADLKQALQND